MNSQKIYAEIVAAFQEIIKELNLHPTRLDIELTMAETVHAYLTALEFSGKTNIERDLMIWPALDRKLSNRALMNLSVCELLATEEDTKEEKLYVA